MNHSEFSAASHSRLGGRQPDRTWRCRGLLLVFLLMGVSSGVAQVEWQIRTNYYVVTGSTLREIHQALRASRPWRATGGTDARTDWKMDYRTQMQSGPDGCRLSQVQVKASVTITLPTLHTPPETPAALKRVWQDYLVKLMAHEQRHVGITRASAEAMLNRIRSMSPDRDCGVLRNRISQVAGQVLEECGRKQAEYDRRTRHGATEGVVFPRRLPGEGNRREDQRRD